MTHKRNGFTLIEMLIVLMIITVLILLIVPSLAKRTDEVHDKGCEALVKSVQAQVNVYQLEKNKLPSKLDDLVSDYVTKDQLTCKNGKTLELNGNVVEVKGKK